MQIKEKMKPDSKLLIIEPIPTHAITQPLDGEEKVLPPHPDLEVQRPPRPLLSNYGEASSWVVHHHLEVLLLLNAMDR